MAADESGISKTNNLKISLQSESTMVSADEDDGELEDIIWSLMGKSGLLGEFKCQVLKFIQEHGQSGQISTSSSSVTSNRIDSNILSVVYEYLHWAGMRNTCAMMLSESPVKVSVTNKEVNIDVDENYKPCLQRMFEKQSDIDVMEEVINTKSSTADNDGLGDLNQAGGPIGKETGDEINFSTPDVLNKTYISANLLPKAPLAPIGSNSDLAAGRVEYTKEVPFVESTFENSKVYIPKETGDNLISTGDDAKILSPNSENQNFSGLDKSMKSDCDTFDVELESVEDISPEVNIKTDHISVSAGDLNAENCNSSDAKEIEHSKENDRSTSYPIISKQNQENSNAADIPQINMTKDTSPSLKSESIQYEEESIEELLEDFSLDTTEDTTVASEKKDISGCDYVMKLS